MAKDLMEVTEFLVDNINAIEVNLLQSLVHINVSQLLAQEGDGEDEKGNNISSSKGV